MLNKKVLFSSVLSLLVLISCNRTSNITVPAPDPLTPISPLPVDNPGNSPSNPVSAEPVNIEKIYAPVLYFDSLEPSPITSVEAYLQAGLQLVGRKGIKRFKLLKSPVTMEDLVRNTQKKVELEGDQLELMLDSKNQISRLEKKVYTRKIEKDGFVFLQYWFFYAYNDTSGIGGNSLIHKCGNHQADWEHIALKIDSQKFSQAINDKDYLDAIEEIYFSQHNKGQNDQRKLKKPGDSELSFEGTHIKAYPARGTHATYYQPNNGNGYQLVSILGIKLFDRADGKGLFFNSKDYLSNMETEAWLKYGGRWGAISDDICNIAEWFSSASNDGPLGPVQQIPGTDWDQFNQAVNNQNS